MLPCHVTVERVTVAGGQWLQTTQWLSTLTPIFTGQPMSEHNRPVALAPTLTDIDVELPANGSHVLAIGLGGKLCEVVWNSKSVDFFKAWCYYPKIPKSVKEKFMNSFPVGSVCDEN
jgi:hypothetical protein